MLFLPSQGLVWLVNKCFVSFLVDWGRQEKVLRNSERISRMYSYSHRQLPSLVAEKKKLFTMKRAWGRLLLSEKNPPKSKTIKQKLGVDAC